MDVFEGKKDNKKKKKEIKLTDWQEEVIQSLETVRQYIDIIEEVVAENPEILKNADLKLGSNSKVTPIKNTPSKCGKCGFWVWRTGTGRHFCSKAKREIDVDVTWDHPRWCPLNRWKWVLWT